MKTLGMSADGSVIVDLSVADGLLVAGKLSEAEEAYKSIVKSIPSEDSYFGLGATYKAKREYINAVKALMSALKINPHSQKAYGLIGDIYADTRQGMQALEAYAQAVATDPSASLYKEKLIHIASSMTFKNMNPNLKGVLLECLETPNIDCARLGNSWLSIIQDDQPLAPFYKLSKHADYESFKENLDRAKTLDKMIDAFFLTGLGLFIVPNMGFEIWCTHLRRYLLDYHAQGINRFSEIENLEFMVCALSRYCFRTDYIFTENDAESEYVAQLQKVIEATDKPALSDLALLACYRPLGHLKNAGKIAAGLEGGDHVSQIPKSQIEDYLEQQKIRTSIQPITAINDEISKAVQGQYEEFPYPRWTSFQKNLNEHPVEGHMRGKKVKILVAGCGTGKEAIELGYAFPEAEILAVDLSLTSLSYAISMANALGIHNITFRQGDIMKLGEIGQTFDYIASSGVLHHMKDPESGWNVLNGLLKKGGIMRIALYSRTARRFLNEARAVVARDQIGSDADSIKAFRKKMPQCISAPAVKGIHYFLDFYALPECRDLLFHVQEHQFDIPRIQKDLDDMGLKFLMFHLPADVLDRYKKSNKDDTEATDLAAWAKWEEKNPDTFLGMYCFWSQKMD